jgi:hypothetical protein
MSLVDLKSDLSKYRSEVSGKEKNTPEASKATDSKNFATLQPITDKLAQMSPQISRPNQTSLADMFQKTNLDDIKPLKTSPIESKLNSTNLDDIVKKTAENLLINSVSEFSPTNFEFDTPSLVSVSTSDVAKKFNEIRKTGFTSRLTSSEIEINKSIAGTNNNESSISINRPNQTFERASTTPDINKNVSDATDNITNPDVNINRQPLSLDREEQSPNISKNTNEATDNIQNPKIVINRKPLSIDRQKESVIISKDLLSPINNIVNPDIALQRTVLSEDRTKQSADIFKENLPYGYITIPEINPLLSDLSSVHLKDESLFNIDSKPKPYNQVSILSNTEPLIKPDLTKYDQQSSMLVDTSLYNADNIVRTNPSGRNDDPSKSLFSIVGTQEVNFFPNINADGFTANQSIGDSKFISDSKFGWSGKTAQAPSVNYISDINSVGFKTFTAPLSSGYVVNSSKFGFIKTPEVDFFDGGKKYATVGFKSFTRQFETAYKTDSSAFTWTGKSDAALEVNYFDVNNTNTTSGFHKLAQLYDTKYIVDSSQFDWDGGRESSPESNYFDITGQYTTAGFHKFAQIYDTKYIPESSQFDWDGSREGSPQTNYFDISGQYVTAGFHKFAQIYDTKYIPEVSIFDWDGDKNSAPVVNYFDISGLHSTAGFHSFAQLYDTKYIAESSVFDWDGARTDAPVVNYFDLTSISTTVGFHSFAALYDTKYIPEASIFDWDGARSSAPVVNYFDLTGKNTTVGFHSFAALYDTKYIAESSIFDWDGARTDAPRVNYFDLTGKNTTIGFHTFAQLYDTKYVPESSIFDWDGSRSDAPFVNYFDITGKNTNAGFHTFAQLYDTKYVHESSIFDWDGFRVDAPFVNYFDITGKNTNAGFHTFAQIYDTKYVHESSIFDWDGFRSDAPRVNYFDLTGKNTTIGFHTFAQIYDTKYVHESSVFDWDGFRTSAPEVNYFDIGGKFTKKGFHRLAEKYDTKYIKESSEFDWDGGRSAAPEVNYFDLSGKFSKKGFHRLAEKYDTKYIKDSSEFDWDGGRAAAKTVDFFGNENAPGFTKFPKALESEYKKDISKFTFKGNQPTPINYFPDSFNKGFTLKAAKLESEYIEDKSEFTWKGGRDAAASVNFLTNEKGGGFTTFAAPLNTEYVTDISQFTFQGARSNAPSVDYLVNTSAAGFNLFPALLETKYKTETSIFAWNGGRSEAPQVNYITDEAGSGFTTLLSPYQSFYTPDFGKYNWKGSRSDAPNVKYFGISPIVRNQIPNGDSVQRSTMVDSGFTTFFDNKANTQLSSGYSSLSTESGKNKSPINDIPATNFFGYTPIQNRGFMVKMNSFGETLYPIIKQELPYDTDIASRNTIESARNSGGIIISDREKYTPVTMVKKAWTTGGVFASLTNQVPVSKVKAESSYYGNPYAKTMNDVTENKGYLAKWAITRNSPSPLDLQYTKFNLRDDAYNKDFGFDQPYVLRDIGQRWGFGIGFDEGLVRGGAVTAAERIVQDVFRIGKFLLSAKGLLFVAKQVGLQLMNPNVDTAPANGITGFLSAASSFGASPTQIYNPLAMLVNVGGSPAGLRIPRHSLFGAIDSSLLNRYGDTTIARELERRPDPASNYFKSLEKPENDGNTFNYSRMIGLMKELLPNSFTPINATSIDISNRSKIARISTWFGGPNAPLGIGGTKIRRARHPYLTMYTTSPILSGRYRNPAYLDTAKRETFFAPYDANYVSGSKYSDKIKKDYTTTQNAIYGIIRTLLSVVPGENIVVTETGNPDPITPSVIPINQGDLNRLVSSNPFEFKRENLYDRLEAKNEFNSIRAGTPLERNLPQHDDFDKIKKYRTVAYSRLGKPKLGQSLQGRSRTFNDFRHDVQWKSSGSTQNGAEAFVSDPRIMRFHTLNMEDYFGLGKQGKVGAQRNIPFLNTVTYTKNYTGSRQNNVGLPVDDKTGPAEFQNYPVGELKDKNIEFRGDRINIIDYKRANFNITHDLVYEKNAFNKSIPGTEDLIEFYFSSLVLAGHGYCPAEIIVFRATFDSIQDTHSPKWNPVKYMGRADPLYVYDGYERSINFGFTVHIGSRDEMKATWRKLNYLASWTAPEYTKGGYIRGPMIRLNIGHLYRKMPGFMSSLTYTFDNAGSTWETAHLPEDRKPDLNTNSPGVLQLPKTVQVSVGFTPVGVYRPEFRGIMYSLYDDTGGSPENGLVPKDKGKVNYFRTYDDAGMDDDSNVKYLPENTVPGVAGSNLESIADDPTQPRDIDGEIIKPASSGGTGGSTGGGGGTGGGS